MDSLALARKPTTDGVLNLAIGEPANLGKLMYPHALVPVNDFSAYPSWGGEADVVDAVKGLTGEKHVVITAGAKMALFAAVYAHKKLRSIKDGSLHVLNKRYWPGFLSVAEISGLSFASRADPLPPEDSTITVECFPNNPDGGGCFDGPPRADIWDACYHTPVFASGYMQTLSVDCDVKVVSAAKRYGMAGLRAGWLATDNEDLAHYAAEYVELATAGVSTVSQAILKKLVLAESYCTLDPIFQKARIDLLQNAMSVNSYLYRFAEISGTPKTGSGMFAIIKPFDGLKFAEALLDSKIQLLEGSAWGEPGVYRMNLGFDVKTTENALEVLTDHLSA